MVASSFVHHIFWSLRTLLPTRNDACPVRNVYLWACGNDGYWRCSYHRTYRTEQRTIPLVRAYWLGIKLVQRIDACNAACWLPVQSITICNLWSFCHLPSWAPLNQWVPWMFEAYGDCSKIVWQFFDLSMPQWLVVIFAGNLVALALIVIAQFFPVKRKNPIR